MLTVYLIRHTEVAVEKGLCYGGSDVALAANYPQQLDRIRTHLPPARPNAVFSSPLSRCRRLAEDLTPNTPPLPVAYDERLREYHFGTWEMTPWSDIPREDLDGWMADFVHQAPHQGDSFLAVYDRVSAFWTERVLPLADADVPGTVYVVAHGGVIRALLCLFLGVPLPNAYRLHLDYGAVSRVVVQNQTYTLTYINR